MLKDIILLKKVNLFSMYKSPEYLSSLQSTVLASVNVVCYVFIVSFCSFLIMGTVIISIFREVPNKPPIAVSLSIVGL